METEEKGFGLKIIFFLLLAGIYYYIDKDTIWTIPRPIFWILVLSTLISLGIYAVWMSRYNMPHVTCNNFTGSILSRPIVRTDSLGNKWLIFKTGAHLYPIAEEGKLATLIIPMKGCKRAGKNYISLTFVEKYPLAKLPNVIHHYLYHASSEYNLDEIYFGRFTEDFVAQHPEISELELEIANLNLQVNKRDKIIEGDNDVTIEMVKSAKEIAGKPSAVDKVLEAIKPQPQNAQ